MKNKHIAGLLAFALGAFGAHHYYLGDKDRATKRLIAGILFYVFSLIVAHVECVKLLSMDQQEFDKLYNGGRCSDVATLLNDGITAPAAGSTASASEANELPVF